MTQEQPLYCNIFMEDGTAGPDIACGWYHLAFHSDPHMVSW